MKISNENPSRCVASGIWVPMGDLLFWLKVTSAVVFYFAFVRGKERETGIMGSEPASFQF